MFKLIKEPEDNPSNILESYRQQNVLMQKIRLLHTAFDGIKLNNWQENNRELPNILIGSICEFEGRLFEATDNIMLEDNVNNSALDLRYIRLNIIRDVEDSNNDYLVAEVVGSSSSNDIFPNYDYDNRGFYTKEHNIIKSKYLRVSMKYNQSLGGYIEKKYWNINDTMRKGLTYKKKTVLLGVGRHTFDVPDSINSITIHLCSGGGGGGYGTLDTTGTDGTNGSDSSIYIASDNIVTCGGGEKGVPMRQGYVVPKGGIAKGKGRLFHGSSPLNGYGGKLNNESLATGGNGGNGSINGIAKGSGGGSGSAAIVEITREMMAGSSRVQIIVGSGGRGGTNSNNHGAVANGDRGQDGSAVIEYFSRG